ncbi:dihydroorotase [Methanobacterium petrolearium]|uniref:dihydroorotase n=2 Tax=Methanobacterium petrolearium TaxID=710190 RepID=UPI001AE5219C|nr:dihydroorotase family protein [Methanobacterium petrolearium]MBP1945820.1 dihydroorotase [Methanobacterium petrolearium]
MLDLCLVNCKLDINAEEVCLGIKDEIIVSIKKLPSNADETIDLKGKIVLPGLIDVHVHFRDPGLTFKEDFHTGSAAAVAGGFTTVLDMPNTLPPTNTPQAFKEKLKIGAKKSLVDFGIHAGVSDLSYIKELVALRPASFKIFMDLVDDDFLMEAFSKINSVAPDHVISLHAEDSKLVQQYTEMMKKEGNDPELYSLARPPQAEIEAVESAISLAGKYNQKVHFCHVSTKKSLQLIHNARTAGCPVTSEITPHHLFLDSNYLNLFGNLAKTNPPLRDKENQLGIQYLPEIDVMGTDHAPHTLEEKEKNVWDAPPGVPGLETILPLLLTQVNRGQLNLKDIKRLLCENPAKIFNIPNKGFISEGMNADLVVVDLKKEGVIDPDNFHSKARYSPFEGFNVKGMPVITMVRGNLVMEYDNIFKNNGQFVY